MKSSELKQLIKEEIVSILNETQDNKLTPGKYIIKFQPQERDDDRYSPDFTYYPDGDEMEIELTQDDIDKADDFERKNLDYFWMSLISKPYPQNKFISAKKIK